MLGIGSTSQRAVAARQSIVSDNAFSMSYAPEGDKTVVMEHSKALVELEPVVSTLFGVPVFRPSHNPDIGSPTLDEEPRLIEHVFGDGYTARGAKGMNSVEGTLTLTWSQLTYAEADTIIDFLRSKGRVQPFFYQLPADTMRMWYCTRWGMQPIQYTIWVVTATFVRAFDRIKKG